MSPRDVRSHFWAGLLLATAANVAVVWGEPALAVLLYMSAGYFVTTAAVGYMYLRRNTESTKTTNNRLVKHYGAAVKTPEQLSRIHNQDFQG